MGINVNGRIIGYVVPAWEQINSYSLIHHILQNTHSPCMPHPPTHTHPYSPHTPHSPTPTHTHPYYPHTMLSNTNTHTVGSEVRVQPFSTLRDDSKLAARVHSLHHSVRDLKQEVETLRSDHATTLSDFQHSMMVTSDRITAAIEAYGKIGGGCNYH